MKIRFFAMIFCLLFCCVIFCGCLSLLAGEDYSQYLTVDGAPETEVELIGSSYWVTLSGIVTNTSSHTFSGVSITYTLYDANNNVVGTATDYCSYLGAYETWAYSALSSGLRLEPTAYLLAELVGYSY